MMEEGMFSKGKEVFANNGRFRCQKNMGEIGRFPVRKLLRRDRNMQINVAEKIASATRETTLDPERHDLLVAPEARCNCPECRALRQAWKVAQKQLLHNQLLLNNRLIASGSSVCIMMRFRTYFVSENERQNLA